MDLAEKIAQAIAKENDPEMKNKLKKAFRDNGVKVLKVEQREETPEVSEEEEEISEEEEEEDEESSSTNTWDSGDEKLYNQTRKDSQAVVESDNLLNQDSQAVVDSDSDADSADNALLQSMLTTQSFGPSQPGLITFHPPPTPKPKKRKAEEIKSDTVTKLRKENDEEDALEKEIDHLKRKLNDTRKRIKNKKKDVFCRICGIHDTSCWRPHPLIDYPQLANKAEWEPILNGRYCNGCASDLGYAGYKRPRFYLSCTESQKLFMNNKWHDFPRRAQVYMEEFHAIHLKKLSELKKKK